MISIEKKQQFIINTLLPYKNNPSSCAVVDGRCSYLTKYKRKCALGTHMRKGPWQKFAGALNELLAQGYTFKEMLTQEAYLMGFSEETWEYIQNYHDFLANDDKYFANDSCYDLEKQLNIDLSVLKFEL